MTETDRGAAAYERYLSGDDGGMEELIRLYRTGLEGFIGGYVCNEAEAEELCEEVFFRLASRRPDWRYRGVSFKAYIYAMGRNLALNQLRREKHRAEEPPEDFSDILTSGETPEDQILRDERDLALHTAMRSLSPDYRAVLYLSYFARLDNAACAAVMRKTKRQIENLLSRARKALRETLEKGGFTYEDQ